MATNLQLLAGYLTEGAIATAAATGSGYDPASAVLLVRSSIWLGVGTSGNWLKVDLGSVKAVTGMGLANSNLHEWTGGTAPTLQWSNDGSTGWTTLVTLDTSAITSTDQDYFHDVSSTSKQYWRVNIPNSVEAPQIGVFYLATKNVLASNYDIGFGEDENWNVERARAASGAVVAERFGRPVKRFDMRWSARPTSEKAALQTILEAEGGPLRPFFYAPRDDAGTGTSGRGYFVRMEESSFRYEEIFTGLMDFSVVLIEEV